MLMHFPALPLSLVLLRFSAFQFDGKCAMCAYVFLCVCACTRHQSGCFLHFKKKANQVLLRCRIFSIIIKNYCANPFKFEILGGKCFLLQTVTDTEDPLTHLCSSDQESWHKTLSFMAHSLVVFSNVEKGSSRRSLVKAMMSVLKEEAIGKKMPWNIS